MAESKNTNKKHPLITYQYADNNLENNDKLNRAFDILFEEVLRRRRENMDLTTTDN